MNKYNAYKHPVYGWVVVKQGFSWPGFFFTWIWAFVKRLWIHGTILLIITIVISSFAFDVTKSALIEATLLVLPGLITGFFGNPWRRKSYAKRGFRSSYPVDARSADDALAKVGKY